MCVSVCKLLFVCVFVERWFSEEMFRTEVGRSFVCTSQQTLLQGSVDRVGLVSVNLYDTQVEAFRVNATNTNFHAIGASFVSVSRVPTGQGKLEKVREFEWSGGNIFLEKSGKMKNRCHQMSDFEAKMHQICFPLGLRPRSR